MSELPDWRTEPVFALTSDTDWASEYAIEQLLGFAAAHRIHPTIFVTHKSPALEAAQKAGTVDLGIHPNFLPGSSHGADVDAVIAHSFNLVPDTKLWRSHAFVDGTHVALKLHAAGIRIDSNVCLYLQRGLVPLEHWVGIRRFPVFWEDDVHWHRGGAWSLEPYRADFFSSGLKIVNVHPFIFALNVPDDRFYQSAKRHIPTLDADSAAALRWQGPGPAEFLTQLTAAVAASGRRWYTLAELAAAR